jgi:hypothetical protein
VGKGAEVAAIHGVVAGVNAPTRRETWAQDTIAKGASLFDWDGSNFNISVIL